jgi:hypothetical protein
MGKLVAEWGLSKGEAREAEVRACQLQEERWTARQATHFLPCLVRALHKLCFAHADPHRPCLCLTSHPNFTSKLAPRALKCGVEMSRSPVSFASSKRHTIKVET